MNHTKIYDEKVESIYSNVKFSRKIFEEMSKLFGSRYTLTLDRFVESRLPVLEHFYLIPQILIFPRLNSQPVFQVLKLCIF